ncbi:hypothetical protein NLJ89_g7406 [Agrocybe chaxingu]|uniref:Protein kinase domain-containing protein n=1 Tax=Agrocybe chaxingu TaxID=84603 RepID=A0A9W8K3P7_9AGAR|nr:hypothetical protein NLJ89_g7406 [Agrocybe chaxingu]
MSVSPSTSSPRTPDERRFSSNSKSTTPNSDDSSIIDDLSFDYIVDQDGNIIRLSKGSSSKSNNSSPPTPQETSLHPDPPNLEPPSQDLHASPVPRISLSRSESAFPILTGSTGGSMVTQNDRPARSFQRVASGPVSSAPSYLAPTSSSLSKPRAAPRRVTTEDVRERHESMGASRAKQTLDANAYALQEEKENISESDEHPYVVQAASVATKRRNSPPLVTRSMSSTSTRLTTARAAYLASSSSSASGRPLADVSAQRARSVLPGPNRVGRIMKSSSATKYGTSNAQTNFDRISEVESSDNEAGGRRSPVIVSVGGEDTEPEDEPLPAAIEPANIPLPQPIPTGAVRARGLSINVNGLTQSGNTRPRRSASLSDALHNDDYQLQLQHQYQNSNSRPGTSTGYHADGAAGPRRVTAQERERQDQDEYRAQDEMERKDEISSSPTHNQPLQSSRSTYGHRRRDSDTLRSLIPPTSAVSLGSPTVVDSNRGSPPLVPRLHTRPSPSATSKGRASPPVAKGRLSPATSLKGRTSPPAKGRLSPATAGKAARDVAKHRRSPTAPEPSMLRESDPPVHPLGKTWAGAEKEERDDEYEHGGACSSGEREREREREREMEREREKDRDRERKWQQSQLSQQQQYSQSVPTISSQSAPPSAAQSQATQFNRHIVVNKKAYARLDMIGKGGSSRVYRVLNHANELYAIKRVSLDKTDTETMNGYMNEIALLKRLDGNSRIIRLIDSELKPGTGSSKGHLLLVMECGEIDLARLLSEQTKDQLNMVWVAYYWQQMLQAVQVIHEEKIVHSDLKPANFVLVRGQLKLIDFGIANAIANDTTNIQRDHQIGTVNYMSPEAIELPDGMRRLKVGRPSDVWSLGIILYQMVYGQPPFQHLSVYHKMKAIPDLTHVIEYPEYSVPTVPSSKAGIPGAPPEPPKRLEHLKVRVRKDVVATIKSCLCRNAKERATIPSLLNDRWLASQEPPPTQPALKENEAVITPYYMHQLLEYGVRLASEGSIDPESLLKDAERLVQELKAIQS